MLTFVPTNYRIMQHQLKIKRAYESAEESDGERILVDRLWPRGIKKEALNISCWKKDMAPSPELRRWFNHEVEKFPEFSQRYQSELDNNAEAAAFAEYCRKGLAEHDITLLFGAKDTEHNQAVVLREWISALIAR